MDANPSKPSESTVSATDRREFLSRCGKFAAITPPAVTLLLSTSLTSQAIAQSGGNNGFGNGGGDGVPGRSDFPDDVR